jgi:josephin
MHCLVHALNNLAQRPAVTPGDLDALADRLAPGAPPLPFFHPHRTALLGNYDVNVLEVALRESLGDLSPLELRWADRRDAAFENTGLEEAVGVIVNVRAAGPLGALLRARHWLALRRVGAEWWDLDGQLAAPARLGGEGAARDALRALVERHDAHVFIVTRAAASGGSSSGAG